MRLVLSTLIALSAVACVSRPKSEAGPMVTLIVTDEAIRPSENVQIQRFGSVAWFYEGESSRELTVTLDRSLGPSAQCSTTLGFVDVDSGTRGRIDRSTTPILCFHDPGEYSYVVEGTNVPLRGKISVSWEE